MKAREIQPGQLVRSKIEGGAFGSGDLFVISRLADAHYPSEFICCRPAADPGSDREFYFRPEELDSAEEPLACA